MAAIDFGHSKPKQIIIAGKANAADTRAMIRLIHERYIPNKLLILADGGAAQAQIVRWLPVVEFMRQGTGRRRLTSAKTLSAGCRRRIFRLWPGYWTASNLNSESTVSRCGTSGRRSE